MMRTTHNNTIFILALLTLNFSALAGTRTLKIFDLKHTQAEEVIETARLFLSEDETAKAHDFQLIVNAKLENLNKIEALIQQLDQPKKSINIYYRDSTQKRNNLYSNNSDNRVSNIASTHNDIKVVRAISGTPVFIQSSRALPAPLLTRPFHHHATDQPAYVEARNGFYARVTVLPSKQVRVELSNQKSAFDHQYQASGKRTYSTETVVIGGLNEWIQIGGATTDQDNLVSDYTVYSTKSLSQAKNSLQIKVEVLP